MEGSYRKCIGGLSTAQRKTVRDGKNLHQYPLYAPKNGARMSTPYEIGVLPRYFTTKNPSPPDVTTTIPDLKNG